MARRWFPVLAICFSAIAVAQTPPPVSWVDEVVPTGATKPHAIGRHNCLDQYPAAAKSNSIEGTTSLGYRIGEDGNVKNVTIRASSGNPILDKAAVACVKAWQYTPAALNEKPIEIAWRNDVKWVITVAPPPQHYVPPAVSPTSPGAVPPPPAPPPVNAITVQSKSSSPPPIAAPASIGKPHFCMEDYPPDAVAELAEGRVTVKFNITVDGATANHQIVESSGYASLDNAAIACTTRWRYKPAIKDGQPIEVPWKAQVLWMFR